MKLSRLALAAALAAVWAALPLAAWAEDGGRYGDEETIEVRKRVHRDDREEGEGERDGGQYERGGGMKDRGGRGGPHDDPAMKEKFEKMRELDRKVRELSKGLRQGSDSEKAAAKIELRKALGELYDAKLAMETAMLEKLEKHAAELKAKIAKKKSSREKAIDSRLARMSGDGDEW